MKVVLTEEAIQDLIRIGRFIARDNPARAETFVAEIEARCLALEAAPEAFRLIPGHEGTGIRRRPYGDYLIFYRIGTGRIDVLHILHGAQDYESILFADDSI